LPAVQTTSCLEPPPCAAGCPSTKPFTLTYDELMNRRASAQREANDHRNSMCSAQPVSVYHSPQNTGRRWITFKGTSAGCVRSALPLRIPNVAGQVQVRTTGWIAALKAVKALLASINIMKVHPARLDSAAACVTPGPTKHQPGLVTGPTSQL
jgi:hypothetical protein